MADITLKASYPLDGLNTLVADTRLSAVENLAIVSVSLPHFLDPDKVAQTRATLNERLKTTFDIELAETGTRCTNGGKHALLGLQPGLWFMVTSSTMHEPAMAMKTVLKDAAFLTDQSDSWAVLDIAGPKAQAALERICAVDIDETVFDDTRVVRTTMEHLSVIVERPETTRFRLYSSASSAQSFLHAVKTSLHNVA